MPIVDLPVDIQTNQPKFNSTITWASFFWTTARSADGALLESLSWMFSLLKKISNILMDMIIMTKKSAWDLFDNCRNVLLSFYECFKLNSFRWRKCCRKSGACQRENFFWIPRCIHKRRHPLLHNTQMAKTVHRHCQDHVWKVEIEMIWI